MGGKSYYCDYCCCYLKNDPNVRKIHNSGLSHTIAKTTYLQRYEDPGKLLAREVAKVPCTRYLKGYCKFDLFCQYSHYNNKQILQLQQIAHKYQLKAIKKKATVESTSKKIQKQQEQQLLPWYNVNYTKAVNKQKKLPSSLRPIKMSKLLKHNFDGISWG